MKRETNLYLESTVQGGKALEVGKVVKYRGTWIFHYWAHPKDLRHSQDAWGMREGILSWLLDHDVQHVYIYDKVGDVTYYLPMEVLLICALRGKTDSYGATINVARKHWIQKKGRIDAPFIPSSAFELVSPAGSREFRAFVPAEHPIPSSTQIGLGI